VARAKIDQWMFWEANNHDFFVAGCISQSAFEKAVSSRPAA
jgi:hypothetical protein